MRRIPIGLPLVLVSAGLLTAGLASGPGAARHAAPEAGALAIDSALVTLIEQAEVPAQVEGVLSSLAAREGQLVSAGDVLAQIEDREPALTLRRAAMELDIARRQADSDIKVRVAKKGAEVAAVELLRARESVEKYKKSVSETELDRLRLAAEKAALDVDQTIHDREIARLTAELKETEEELARFAVDRRKIVAPLAGVVAQVHQHRGEWVQPGETLLRLVRVDRLRVEALVSVKKLPPEVTGRRATLVVDPAAADGEPFEGAVVFVSPEVNPVDGKVRVWAEIDNRDLALRPGMQGTLTIHSGPARTAGKDAARPTQAAAARRP